MDAAAHREFKDRLFEQFARIGKALASPKRLEILDLLAQGERTVEQIARETAMPVANASQHLQVLKAARMIDARREGLYSCYRLADEDVFRTWQAVRALGESRLAEVDRVVETYLKDRDALEAIDSTALMERLSDGSTVVLDVRPEEEYWAGHIPGALSVPVDALEAALQSLPKDKEIVAYCRGPFCVFSDEAIRLLHRHGFRARRLSEGFPEWQAAGYPVEGKQMEKKQPRKPRNLEQDPKGGENDDGRRPDGATGGGAGSAGNRLSWTHRGHFGGTKGASSEGQAGSDLGLPPRPADHSSAGRAEGVLLGDYRG
jgi:rhodanese-related sulfurtransferase